MAGSENIDILVNDNVASLKEFYTKYDWFSFLQKFSTAVQLI